MTQARGGTLPVTIANRAGTTIECHAVAGHWHGFDLGAIPGSGEARIGFGLDRASGTVTLPNAAGVSLPIQYVYCGLAGQPWQSRAYLPLRALASAGQPARVACSRDGARLACR